MTTWTRATTRLGGITLALALAASVCMPGCGALVGADCRAGLTRCGHTCLDLASDRLNCGACGHVCVGSASCVAGVCGGSLDAGVGDGGSGVDGGRDAGRDAGRDGGGGLDAGADTGTADVGTTDVGTTDAGDLDVGPVDADLDAGGPMCGLGQLLCGASCVDPNDPAHCGDCTTMCTSMQVCAAGTCTSTCAPLTDCGTFCADLTNDPDHCGTCTNSCGTGICVAGVCEAALAGHLVVIGHDFEQRRITMSSILANAVLLPGRPSVRVLVWVDAATALALAGTLAGLAEGAAPRAYTTVTATTPESVPVLLDTADTFLVLGQANATDAGLSALGTTWTVALAQFLNRGGVIVVLEAPSLNNAGTFQILRAAGLFDARTINEIIHPRLSTVPGRAGDPVLVGVPLSYRGEIHTVFYTTTDPNAIVESTSGPVIFDRIVVP